MNWTSPSEFFAMGGYAVYVWGSVAACIAAVAGELVVLHGRRASIGRMIRRRAGPRPTAATERTA